MKKNLKALETFLKAHEIEYTGAKFGGDYFHKPEIWDGFIIRFDYSIAPDRDRLRNAEESFIKYIKRHPTLDSKYITAFCPVYYVLDSSDSEALSDYQDRVNKAVAAFEKEYHERRTA